ncbi:MAG: flagellar hook-length control protein FliK [Spirochaetaceae bacterium]|jgi:flagellar hook-length control protein FliK|nr:flagellar hook-length control protein FliK [Spirochaetaceae bacterium]
MMQVSPRMYTSDGSLEGMSRMDEGGEASSLRPKQGQGKASKDKFSVFARLLEGLVKNSPGGGGVLPRTPEEGQKVEVGDEAQGNTRKKNQRKKRSLAGVEGEEGKSSRSGKAAPALSRGSQHTQDSGGALAFLSVQENLNPRKTGLQKKDTSSLGQDQTDKPKRFDAPRSRTEAGAPELSVHSQVGGSSRETGSPETNSALKASNASAPDASAAEKTGSSKVGTAWTSPSAEERGKSELELSVRMTGTREEPGVKDPKKEGEVKVRDKRRERLDIQDLRSREGAEVVSSSRVPGETSSGEGLKTLEFTVDLQTDTPDREVQPLARQATFAGSFEDLLSRELSQHLNGDIVRHAQVLLRDGGQGTIRLALRPESLGNVKIQLEMAEKKITGHIIVESNEALRAFEREIHSLEQAFKDSGFGETSLDTALASGMDGQGADPRQRNDESGPFFSERLALSTYDTASDKNGEGGLGFMAAGNGGVSGHIPIDMLV